MNGATRQLQVWLNQDRVGLLGMERGQLFFAYSPQWLASSTRRPLSVSLPLQSAPFDHHQTRAYFAGLLP